jgi:hypothetical protein
LSSERWETFYPSLIKSKKKKKKFFLSVYYCPRVCSWWRWSKDKDEEERAKGERVDLLSVDVVNVDFNLLFLRYDIGFGVYLVLFYVPWTPAEFGKKNK